MENYGIMRHCSYKRGTDKLTKEGVVNAKRVAKKIKTYIKKNGYKEIVIYHSSSTRTMKTAMILQVEMNNLAKEGVEELYLLGEYSNGMSKKRIEELTQDKKKFYIFVTHQPNVILFLARRGIDEKVVTSFFWSNKKIIKP